jgi:hypothetical protein
VNLNPKVLLLMLRYLFTASLILAAAAAFYLWYTWPTSPDTTRIFINQVTPRATVVLVKDYPINEK